MNKYDIFSQNILYTLTVTGIHIILVRIATTMEIVDLEEETLDMTSTMKNTVTS